MAKRVRRAAAAAEPKSTTSTVKAITPGEFKTLNTKVKAAERVMSEERASLGGIISDAVEHKHLHKTAYAVWRKFNRMSDVKRAEALFHFDVYRERSDWNAQPDMMPDRGGQAEDDPPETESASAYAGVDGEQLGAAIDAAEAPPTGFPDNDDADLRPRHLRTGSATDPKLN